MEIIRASGPPGYNGNPHWSPGGDWIVFISGRACPGVQPPSFSWDGTTIVANRTVAGVTDMVRTEFDEAAAPPSPGG